MRRFALYLVAGALLLAGCGGGEEASTGTSSTTVPATSSTPLAPPTTSTTTAPPAAVEAAPVPPPTVPPLTEAPVDLCTQARTAAVDFELTHEESAARFDQLATQATDPGFAAALTDLAGQFRAGASSVSTAGIDAYCP